MFENIIIQIKNKFSSIHALNTLSLVFSIVFSFCIATKQSYALSHEWVGGPISEYGEQLWDRKSIKRNEDGSVPVSYTHLTLPTTPYV